MPSAPAKTLAMHCVQPDELQKQLACGHGRGVSLATLLSKASWDLTNSIKAPPPCAIRADTGRGILKTETALCRKARLLRLALLHSQRLTEHLETDLGAQGWWPPGFLHLLTKLLVEAIDRVLLEPRISEC